MRIRVGASSSPPAALALARVLGVSRAEAAALLRETRVLPAEFSAQTLDAALTALRAAGLAADPLDVPPTTNRCATHPTLTADTQCATCRQSVCPLCAPECPPCAARRATSARWRRLRIGALLLVLLGVVVWGALRQRATVRRNAWLRPLRVSLVLVSALPVDEDVRTAWTDGAARLDAWFAGEAERLGFRFAQPLHFTLAPVVVQGEAPVPPSTSGEWWRDSQAALELRATLEGLADQGGDPSAADLRIVVALREEQPGAHRVEGLGEAGGSIGLVDGTTRDTALTLELLAVAHETLHLVGAQDGYDERGHALAPRGYVDPDRGLPQDFAEVMVGEVPLAPDAGRLPRSLDEVRIGPATAAEIGWRIAR